MSEEVMLLDKPVTVIDRADPGGQRLFTLPSGSRFVLERTVEGERGSKWAEIRHSQGTGFIPGHTKILRKGSKAPPLRAIVARFAAASVLLVLCGLFVWRNVAIADLSNWWQTTGSLGVGGFTSAKSGGAFQVNYVDKQGKSVITEMHLPNETVRRLASNPIRLGRSEEERAWVYTGTFGDTVCLESVLHECMEEARMPWFLWLLIPGLTIVACLGAIRALRVYRFVTGQ